MLEVFMDKAHRHLTENFEKNLKDKTDLEIKGIILQGIEHAKLYDITDEQSVILFIDLTVAIGPDFEDRKGNEWMLPILKKKGLSQTEKMEFIYTALEDRSAE